MTVDERIEKLTERHEALAQSIELMVLGNREREKERERESRERERENREREKADRERDEKWDRRFGQLISHQAMVTDAVDKLSHIAELHQHRLDSHDDRLDQLEGTA